jgi:hypothetical protein
VEHQAVVELQKTKEQRDKEKFNVWPVTHPEEYKELEVSRFWVCVTLQS